MIESCVPLKIIEIGPSRLALVGELDVAGVPELEALLASRDGDVVLDCSELAFVDASGLGLFLSFRDACEARGATFTLVEPSPRVLRLLSILGLDADFLISLNGSSR